MVLLEYINDARSHERKICTIVSEAGDHKCAEGPSSCVNSAQQTVKVLSFRFSPILSFIGRISEIRKSDYQLRRVCPSVFLSLGPSACRARSEPGGTR